jgi:hypothetical protein
MREENVREWGKVLLLGSVPFRTDGPMVTTTSPTPPNLTYSFTPALPAHELVSVPPPPTSTSYSLIPLSCKFDPFDASAAASQALALKYGHPRIIEHEDKTLPARHLPKLVLPFLLTTFSVFAIWYIYRVTGQQLQLQAEIKSYLETLAQEKQARAGLVAPQTKVIALRGGEKDVVEAKLFWDTNNQTGQVFLSHLPQAAPNQVFQLWYFTKEAKFVRVKAFQAVNGTAELQLQLPSATFAQLERVIVSLETPGDYPFPVGKILLRGYLP